MRTPGAKASHLIGIPFSDPIISLPPGTSPNLVPGAFMAFKNSDFFFHSFQPGTWNSTPSMVGSCMESKEEKPQNSEHGAGGEKEVPKKDPFDWDRDDVIVLEDDGEID